MKLYFGNTVTIITTLLLIGLIGFVVYSFINRNNIQFWGRRTLILAAFGLLICCFAATRDGLDKTIQCTIDGNCAPGIFSLVSIPTIIGCVGAAVIIITGIITVFTKKQDLREMLFFAMSGGTMIKILTIEIARIFEI